MSTRILILKDGIITPSRSSSDIGSIVTSLGLTKASVGLNLVDNTSDANKPISTATQTALNLKAPLVSPSFTTPNLGTPSAGVMTNVTGLPLTTGVTDILPIANGGTGSSTQNFVDLTTTQNVSGDKYYLDTVLVGTNNALTIQPYSNPDIKIINGVYVLNSTNGNLVLTSNPAGTFACSNLDFYIDATSSTPITSAVVAGHYRVRNYATALYSSIQGLRLTALNSGTGNVTTLEGAVFTARNDTTTTVTTVNGGSFNASISNIAGTATTINGGVFTSTSGSSALSTTVRGILINASSSNTTPATNCIGIEIANITGTATNKFAIRTGTGIVSLGDTTASTSTTTGALIVTGGVGADHIKVKNAWLLEARSGVVAQDFNTQVYGQFAATRWFDGSATNTNGPSNAGMLLQFDSLFGTGATESKYRVQEFITNGSGVNARFWKRTENNGVWGTWLEIGFLEKNNTWTGTQNFSSQINIAATKVLGTRDTGWTAPTGTANKGAFASDTATLLDVARRIFSIETALRTHGLLGT